MWDGVAFINLEGSPLPVTTKKVPNLFWIRDWKNKVQSYAITGSEARAKRRLRLELWQQMQYSGVGLLVAWMALYHSRNF